MFKTQEHHKAVHKRPQHYFRSPCATLTLQCCHHRRCLTGREWLQLTYILVIVKDGKGAHQSSHSPRASTCWGAMYNITMTGSGKWLQAGSWVRTGTFYTIVKSKARVLLKSALLLSGWIMHCLVHYRLFKSTPGPCLYKPVAHLPGSWVWQHLQTGPDVPREGRLCSKICSQLRNSVKNSGSEI